MPTYQNSEPGEGRNSPYRANRRESQHRDSQKRSSGRSRRGQERRLSVCSELREQPDVRKIARAVIQMALAQAEADAQQEAASSASQENHPDA